MQKLFGNYIDPMCRYCSQGCLTQDGVQVLCKRHGIVAPDFKCRHYLYDPLLRVPKRPVPMPVFTEEDFTL